MKIASHLIGTVIAYDNQGGNKKKSLNPKPGRVQGSLYNFQKRQVQNACEWIRTHSLNRPMFFVATTNYAWGDSIFFPKVAQFVHTLKNGYGLNNYVWVRELNKRGAPHYHFVCDMPFIENPVQLSLYWSGLFGGDAKNSVRLGSKPDKRNRRTYYLENRSHSYYLSKYLSKKFGEKQKVKIRFKKFGISKQAGELSKPKIFESNYFFQEQSGTVMNAKGEQVPRPSICIGRKFTLDDGTEFNPHNYTWKQIEKHTVYFGRLK